MIQVPPDIAEQTARRQAEAPYCGLGFTKARLDEGLHTRMMEKLRESTELFRAENKINEVRTLDRAYIPALYYEDHEFNREIGKALKPTHEKWSDLALESSACYGFRVYQRGCYLHNHVDSTDTHIISSTICIDHALDSPWPLYIEDINGKAYQVDMEPGELVYYEGARLVHGRPWPLNGDYYVGMFVHYRPVAHRG